jgi:hypothetical protein
VFRVFGVLRRGDELGLLAELCNTNGAAFELNNFDDDGQTEVGTLEYVPPEMYDGHRPLSDRPLRSVYYRWQAVRMRTRYGALDRLSALPKRSQSRGRGKLGCAAKSSA